MEKAARAGISTILSVPQVFPRAANVLSALSQLVEAAV
jgi:hypothetical protein